MIVLITDFGIAGPYIGQMLASIRDYNPEVPVINLFADAPAHNPRATAYLLPPYTHGFPEGTIFLCVVDPAVGSGTHRPSVLMCEDRWYVGPDNGLFEIIRRRAATVRQWEIAWRPPHMSASFHGRDLYAPVAARLSKNDDIPLASLAPLRFANWPDDLAEIVYIDHFGNAMTGLRASKIPAGVALSVKGHTLRRATTFASVPVGEGFWYENSNGLVEIAVNRGRAEERLGVRIGDPFEIA